MIYTPKTIETGDVELSPELLLLTERIAANVHDVWAAGRIADGWRHGETRNDVRKLHPCLVPYEELPESEKEYDRKTAMETLKVIKKMGFRIEK
jgi:ryanodine receptor 2